MLDLKDMGVQEMNAKELKKVNGGSWIKRAWNNTVEALESAYEWCKDTLSVDVQIGRV